MSFYFYEHLRYPQVEELAKQDALILIPVGMLEEHGPHLPVSTDNIIASGVARLVAQRIGDHIPTIVMPCVFTGYHGQYLTKWGGSVTVRPESLYHYVYDMTDSLCKNGFRKFIFINAHGQNPAILEMVCRRITDAHNVIPALTYAMGMIGPRGAQIRTSGQGGAAGHACEIETSLVLALAPELVDMSQAKDETCPYRSAFHRGDLYPDQPAAARIYWSSFHLQKPQYGILGDATAATPEKGLELLNCIVETYERFAEEYYRFECECS